MYLFKLEKYKTSETQKFNYLPQPNTGLNLFGAYNTIVATASDNLNNTHHYMYKDAAGGYQKICYTEKTDNAPATVIITKINCDGNAVEYANGKIVHTKTYLLDSNVERISVENLSHEISHIYWDKTTKYVIGKKLADIKKSAMFMAGDSKNLGARSIILRTRKDNAGNSRLKKIEVSLRFELKIYATKIIMAERDKYEKTQEYATECAQFHLDSKSRREYLERWNDKIKQLTEHLETKLNKACSTINSKLLENGLNDRMLALFNYGNWSYQDHRMKFMGEYILGCKSLSLTKFTPDEFRQAWLITLCAVALRLNCRDNKPSNFVKKGDKVIMIDRTATVLGEVIPGAEYGSLIGYMGAATSVSLNKSPEDLIEVHKELVSSIENDTDMERQDINILQGVCEMIMTWLFNDLPTFNSADLKVLETEIFSRIEKRQLDFGPIDSTVFRTDYVKCVVSWTCMSNDNTGSKDEQQHISNFYNFLKTYCDDNFNTLRNSLRIRYAYGGYAI